MASPDVFLPPPQRPKTAKKRSFASIRSIIALILREMATSYGRSPGGYIWAVLEPIAGIAVMTLVFMAVMRSPPLGVSFPIFYATGMLPFSVFMGIQNKVSGGLTYSKPLLAYPPVTFIDSLIARFILDLMTKLLVGYIVLTGCIVLFDTRVTPNLPIIIQSYALAAFLGLGVGTLNCFLFTRFPLYQTAWGIATRPLFIISCVFFLYETIPAQYQTFLWYNPLVHVVGLMRRGFYSTYDAPYVYEPYVIGLSLVSLALGLVFLRRYHTDLLAR